MCTKALWKRKVGKKCKNHLISIYSGTLMNQNSYNIFQIFRNKTSVLDALTWHHYYLDGHTAKLQDFLCVQRLDYFLKMMKTIKRFLDENSIKKPLWLGETSSAYGGGAHGLSDRYGMYVQC